MSRAAATIVLDQQDVAGPDIRDLYDQHGAYIRHFLRRLVGPAADLDDLTQEVFVIAWKKRRGIPAEFAQKWLCGVAVRAASSSRRSHRLKQFLGIDAAESLPDLARSPVETAESSEAERILYAALDRMSEKRRMVLILYEIEELTGPEIATVLDVPVNTVWTRLFHARRELTQRVVALERRGTVLRERR